MNNLTKTGIEIKKLSGAVKISFKQEFYRHANVTEINMIKNNI